MIGIQTKNWTRVQESLLISFGMDFAEKNKNIDNFKQFKITSFHGLISSANVVKNVCLYPKTNQLRIAKSSYGWCYSVISHSL